MRKKVLVLAFFASLALAMLTACGDKNNTTNTTTPTGTATEGKYHPCGGSVKLGAYKGMTYTREVKEVTEEDVNKEIAAVLRQYPNYKKDELRTGTLVKEGDALNIDYSGRLASSNVAFDGGTAKDAFLVIGSNKFIPGFESSLIGKTVGETVDINVTFPDSYPNNPNLAGVATIFTVTINYVGTAVEDIDDAYVKRYLSNVATSAAELRELLLKELKEEAEQDADDSMWDQILDQVIQNAVFASIDQKDINYYYDQNLAKLRQYAAYYKTDEETMYKTLYSATGKSYSEFLEDNRAASERTVKEFMVLQEIAKAENMTLTTEEYDEAVAGFMSKAGATVKADFEAEYGKDYLMYCALNDKVLAFLRDNAVKQ